MVVPNGYKQTEVGVIPEDWQVIGLGELGESIIGLTYSPANVKEFGTLVLRSSNIQNSRLAYDDNVYVDMELPQRVFVKQDDILICVRNGSKQLIGKCALIDASAVGSAFGAFMTIYRSSFNKYIIHQFRSNVVLKQINEVMGATINQITNKDLAGFKVPCPPTLKERDAIAEALSDMDALINSLEQQIEKKKAIKHGMMQELLKPKEGWVTKKLGEISLNISSGKSQTDSSEGKYPVYGSTGIIGLSENFDYEGEKILIARVGANAGTLNIVSGKYCVSDNTLMVTVDNRNDLSFIFYLLLSFKLNRLVFGSGQPLITGGQLKAIELSMPSISEQLQITQILLNIDQEIQMLIDKSEKNRQVKQAMMQSLLTGKIRLV